MCGCARRIRTVRGYGWKIVRILRVGRRAESGERNAECGMRNAECGSGEGAESACTLAIDRALISEVYTIASYEGLNAGARVRPVWPFVFRNANRVQEPKMSGTQLGYRYYAISTSEFLLEATTSPHTRRVHDYTTPLSLARYSYL
jgi:hypothetical protein